MRAFARIADCPDHGLHGERERCNTCGAKVSRPLYISARAFFILQLVLLLFMVLL